MLSKPVRTLRFFGLCAVALAVTAAPALAAKAECAGFERRLAKLEKAGAAGGGKWADAARRQSKALASAQRDAAHYRCGTQAAAQACAGLTSKIKKMKANLAKIERQQARSGGASGGRNAEIRKLRRALASHRCKTRDTRTAATRKPRAEGQANGFLAKIFNNQAGGGLREMPSGLVMTIPGNGLIQVRSGSGDLQATRSRAVISTGRYRQRIPAGGTFRTLCVRTCDGFAFPISFATGKDNFADDAARCTEMCPAAETELFVYKNPGESQADMVSLSGVVYGEMDNAYRYQREYVEGCSCRSGRTAGAQSNMTAVTTSSDGAVSLAGLDPHQSAQGLNGIGTPPGFRFSSFPMTTDQLPSDADPDTLLNLKEGFDATAAINERRTTGAGESNVARLGSQGRPEMDVLGSRRPAPDTTGAIVPAAADQGPKRPSRIVGPKYLDGQ